MTESVRNALVTNHALRTFVINPLVYIYQKENIAQEISANISAFSHISNFQCYFAVVYCTIIYAI